MAFKEEAFYGKLLKLKWPWHVERVAFDEEKERIDIYLAHDRNGCFLCKSCGQEAGVYDHAPERTWRHLNLFEFEAHIHARLPRTHCKQCGVKLIVNNWAEGASPYTAKFESFVIDLAKECSVEGVRRIAGLTWDQVWGEVERAVKRGQARKERRLPTRIGVDEKSFARRHKYETIVCDLDAGTVEYVGDGRGEKSLDAYFSRFTKEERAGIEAVAMDMWDPYIKAVKAHVPNAEKKIVFDKFHMVRHMVDAVDKVRRQEHKALTEQGLDWLKKTKHLWLYNEENVPEERLAEFKKLRGKDLKVGRAWSIKEHLRWLWDYRSKAWARKFFNNWYGWAIRSQLPAVVKVAKMLKAHLENVLTYFDHRITNALAEGINSRIEKIKRMACGFRNRSHYRAAIYFHCGGLDVYPKAGVC